MIIIYNTYVVKCLMSVTIKRVVVNEIPIPNIFRKLKKISLIIKNNI